jgi:hypothetical protein
MPNPENVSDYRGICMSRWGGDFLLHFGRLLQVFFTGAGQSIIALRIEMRNYSCASIELRCETRT